MKVAVIGSRSLGDDCYETVLQNIPRDATEIISGGARGADELAVRAARELGLPMRVILPDYSTGLGKLAPLMRNTRIVEAADLVLAFWDGRSPGTRDAVAKAKELGKPIRIIYV